MKTCATWLLTVVSDRNSAVAISLMEETVSLHRLGPICGLLFAPHYAAFVFIPQLPEASYSDEQVLDLYRDSGSSNAILLGSLSWLSQALSC